MFTIWAFYIMPQGLLPTMEKLGWKEIGLKSWIKKT
jgi:hypothetical protein